MSRSPEKKSEEKVERLKDQIYIGNLSERIAEKDLRREFEKFGGIKNVILKHAFAFIVFFKRYFRRSIVRKKQQMQSKECLEKN